MLGRASIGVSFPDAERRATVGSPARRLALNRRALAMIEQDPGLRQNLSRLAHHAEEAGDREAVLTHAVAAARQAATLRAHREAAAQYARALRFADHLPEMRRITSEHLRHEKLDREKVLATMVRLMNAAHFRVGEERYAKKNKTYGIATLRRKHLKIVGDTMVFEYTGV